MIAKYKFENFEFKAFFDFIWDLIYRFKMGGIRFTPHQGGCLFNTHQLTHIGPSFDPNNVGDFLYVWSRNDKLVRTVSFEQFHKSGIPKIKITFNLNEKTVTFESIEGMQKEDIENSLKKFFKIQEGVAVESISKWWKYAHPVWWVWFVLAFIFRDGIWALLKLAWKYKWISGIVLLVVIPVIVGLCINYLTWKFGWK